MGRFIGQRLAITIPMVLIVVSLTWGLIRLAPGNFYTGEKAIPAAIEANIRPARPDSRTPDSSSLSAFVPAAPPRKRHAATNTAHRPMADHGCVALHRAIRTVAGFLRMVRPSARAGRFLDAGWPGGKNARPVAMP